MEIIIEEISRSYKLLNRYRLNKDEVQVGRSYHNDIIMSDPHISPEHLAIKFNGDEWLVEDQNSTNGSFLEDGKTPVKDHVISSGDTFSLGNSFIRVLFADHPVDETLKFSTFENLINLVRNPILLGLSLLIFTIVSGYLFYLNKPINVNFDQMLAPAIGMTLLFSAWPIGVALISHLTKNEARVMAQLGISFMIFNLFWLSDIVESTLLFNFSSNWPISTLFSIVPIGLAFCLFWLNGYIGFHMSSLRRSMVAGGLTLLFFGGSYLIQVSNKPEFSPYPQYNATIMTPAFLLLPTSNVDKFLNDSKKLFKNTQKEAANKKDN